MWEVELNTVLRLSYFMLRPDYTHSIDNVQTKLLSDLHIFLLCLTLYMYVL